MKDTVKKELVGRVVSDKNDMGIPYWIDVDGTYSGENFKEVIVNAIKQSQLVIVLYVPTRTPVARAKDSSNVTEKSLW